MAGSRGRAQALIMAGLVYSDDRRFEKPGTQVNPEIPLEVRGREYPWVSRGGVKLDHALSYFGIDVTGSTCLDVGASTGGFTDVLLSRGASMVYAVDVGRGQLDWKLRQEEKVILLEKTNARYLTKEDIPTPISFLVCDVSFINLRTVLPKSMELVSDGGYLVALIKPQFEVGKGLVGSGGIVSDPDQHKLVCDDIADWLSGCVGWCVKGVTSSPITGAKGNKEFLIAAHKSV